MRCLRLRAAGANNQPRARNDHAYRSVALGTKHSVVVRRPSNVYEPVRSSDEYWASWTKYWVLRTTRFGRSVESDRMGLRREDMNPSSNHGRLVIRRLGGGRTRHQRFVRRTWAPCTISSFAAARSRFRGVSDGGGSRTPYQVLGLIRPSCGKRSSRCES